MRETGVNVADPMGKKGDTATKTSNMASKKLIVVMFFVVALS